MAGLSSNPYENAGSPYYPVSNIGQTQSSPSGAVTLGQAPNLQPTTNPPLQNAPASQPNNTSGSQMANVPITSYEQGQITNPTPPANTTLTPALQQVQNGENLTGQTSQLNPTSANVATTPQVQNQNVQQTQAQAGQVNPNAATNTAGINPTGNTYQAALTGGAQGQAAQMQVNPMDTLQGQLTGLYASFNQGVPPWAQGAINQANQEMAARGMGSSSIGAAAVASAMQQSAIQIAAQDANTYFQTDLANLSNTQQTNMQNLQNRQQALLSDQSAINAAQQFNATSTTQMQQFVASLVQNTLTQNADRTTAISQFNAGQANTISATNASNQLQAGEFNAQQVSAIEQFNSSLQNQRDQFNAQNAFAVEQSNVTWRRNINTANTAAVNAANQVNVQNAFNLSSTALNNIWQQFRDESSWIFQAGQNQNTINANFAIAANNQNFILQQQASSQAQSFLTQIGSFAASLLVGG